jgi:hypothetical protein
MIRRYHRILPQTLPYRFGVIAVAFWMALRGTTVAKLRSLCARTGVSFKYIMANLRKGMRPSGKRNWRWDLIEMGASVGIDALR